MRRYLKVITEHAPEDIRKTVAQAFVKNLRVDSPTQVTPTYRIIGARPDSLVCEPVLGDDETSVRAMTSLVELRGLEPLTSGLQSRRSTN